MGEEVTPKDFSAYLSDLIKQAISTYLKQEQIDFDVEQLPIDLRFSAQSSFGDYSMPVMPWASKKVLNRPPLPLAEALSSILRDYQSPLIQEITATKPGFVNFRLNQPAVGKSIIERVQQQGNGFGFATTGNMTKVVVEHTAMNPNKAAHVGHLRNSCIGDTVVRMLRAQGYPVEAQNYIDDSGVQVADVVVGFQMMQQGKLSLAEGNDQLPDESFDYYCSRVYVAVGKLYAQKETDLGKQALDLRRQVLHAIEHGNEPESGPDYPTLAADLAHQIVQMHLKTMSRLNIPYDLLTWESAILQAGLWQHTFDMLRERNLLDHPDSGPAAGCWILPFGDGEEQKEQNEEEQQRMQDKILVRSDGTATYTAKDISNQLWKFGLTDDLGVQFHYLPWGKQYDERMLWSMRTPSEHNDRRQEADPKRFGHAKRAINVIDVRQSYPQQVVYESLRRLGYTEQADNSTHIGYEVVTLSRATAASLGIDTSDGRAFYPMSGRKGIEIKADDLINAATERMLEQGRQKDPNFPESTAETLAASAIRYFMIRFSLNQIIALDIDEALRPNGDTGVYLQYAYARANSIVRRLLETGYRVPEQLTQLPEQLDKSEWELLRHIDAFPRRLAEATEQLSPSLLAAYAYDLAAHFSDFFEHTSAIIREQDETIKAFRSSLVRTTIQTMKNVLLALGFEPLEQI